MTKEERGWRNPAKSVETNTEGICPFCHKRVNSLEHHIQDRHRGEKPIRE